MSLLLQWSMLEDPAILEGCKDSLRENGVMVLKDFATKDGLEKLKEEVLAAPYNDSKQHYTPWQDQGDQTGRYPPDHPRNFRIHSSAAFVGRKTLETATKDRLCVSVYEDSENETQQSNYSGNEHKQKNRLVRFLSHVAAKPLYPSRDENGSVYSYRIHPDHNPPWHFDESPYTAILYLQNAEGGGGEFEYVPWCRPTTSKDDTSGHEIVRKLLMERSSVEHDGDSEMVKQVIAEPGSLVFFCGAKTFHRAAPITGPGLRVGLVFTYGETEGFSNSDNVRNSNEWDLKDAAAAAAAFVVAQKAYETP